MATVRTPKRQAERDDGVTIKGWRGTYGALGYRSARVASAEGRSYVSYPGSAHEERDRLKLINQSRDFFRNNPIYEGLIERMVSYIIGNGFELQVTGSRTAVKKIEKLWKDYQKSPEIRGLLNGAETAKMIMREIFVCGDTLAIKTDKGLLQLIEAEQIDGDNQYANGIRKDKYGRPIFFHICPWSKYNVDKRNGKSVPAKDVLFLTSPRRPSQVRGVPACQSAFPMLHRINDVCDSEAIAWQVLSRLAATVERENANELAYTEAKEDPNKSSDELEGDAARMVTELDYAILFHAKPGEKITGIDRTIPGKDFPQSIRMFLRLLGLPIGAPLELVLLDWTQSNYSQSRAVLEQAFENFIGHQKKMIDYYYDPQFRWKLKAWQSQGQVGRSVRIEHSWITPTFPWLDLLKEVQAWAQKVERGFTTHSMVCKSLKVDRDEIIEKREAEVRDAIERASKIEIDTGKEVPWEIFAGLERPGKSAQKAGDQNKEQEKEEEKEDE